MVKDHKADLKEFQKEAQSADDADLRAFATSTATIVAQHFEAAKQMRDTVKAEPGVAQR